MVIPAYNESQRITGTLERILAHAREAGWAAEILVVDDGSRDPTAALVREFAARHPEVRLLENPGNRGKGYSVRHGMLEARGEVMLFTDADLSAPIAEAERLFAALEQGAEVAIGSRWLQAETQTQRQPLLRQAYGRLFNLLLRAVLGLPFKDTQCGFKAFTRRAAQSIFPRQRVERWAFDPELLFLARKYGLPVREVAVGWGHDQRSKISPLRDGLRMGWDVLRIRGNDLRGRYGRPGQGEDAGPAPATRAKK